MSKSSRDDANKELRRLITSYGIEDQEALKKLKAAKKELTSKQYLFALNFIKTDNATQAAKDAGYSPNSAEVIGWENLRKPKIVEFIKIFTKTRESKAVASAEEVLKTLTSVMRQEIDITEQSIKIKGSGKAAEREVIQRTRKASHMDIINAANLLGKHHNSWSDQLIDLKEATINITIDDEEYDN